MASILDPEKRKIRDEEDIESTAAPTATNTINTTRDAEAEKSSPRRSSIEKHDHTRRDDTDDQDGKNSANDAERSGKGDEDEVEVEVNRTYDPPGEGDTNPYMVNGRDTRFLVGWDGLDDPANPQVCTDFVAFTCAHSIIYLHSLTATRPLLVANFLFSNSATRQSTRTGPGDTDGGSHSLVASSRSMRPSRHPHPQVSSQTSWRTSTLALLSAA